MVDLPNYVDGILAKQTSVARRRTSDVIDTASKILQLEDMLNPENLEALLSFITYLAAKIKGMTIVGNIRPPFHGFPTSKTLLISAFSDWTTNLEIMSEICDMTSITGVRILKNQIRTE